MTNMMRQNKIREILESLSGYFLYAESGGSIWDSLINLPHDYDIIVICKDLIAEKKCRDFFNNIYSRQELKEKYSLDFHFELIEHDQTNYFLNTTTPYYILKREIIMDPFNIAPKEEPLSKLLESKDIIFNTYKNRLKQGRILTDNIKRYQQKLWYQIYLTLCIFKNNSYELTDEQKENINILHDRKESDLAKRVELIDTMIAEIEEY